MPSVPTSTSQVEDESQSISELDWSSRLTRLPASRRRTSQCPCQTGCRIPTGRPPHRNILSLIRMPSSLLLKMCRRLNRCWMSQRLCRTGCLVSIARLPSRNLRLLNSSQLSRLRSKPHPRRRCQIGWRKKLYRPRLPGQSPRLRSDRLKSSLNLPFRKKFRKNRPRNSRMRKSLSRLAERDQPGDEYSARRGLRRKAPSWLTMASYQPGGSAWDRPTKA